MPESTLSLSLADLRSEVAQYLGYKRDYDALAPEQATQVDTSINAGLRQFYYPQSAEGTHAWSFLTPVGTLTTAASVQAYDMPDDFASLVGDLTFASTLGVIHTIRRYGIGWINERTQRGGGVKGKPEGIAIVPLKHDGAMGQRFQVVFFPTPDAAYVLTYQYRVLPLALTAANPWPYGGLSHAETLLESCLAVAESRIQDEQGLHAALFAERLSASVATDARDHAPDFLGYNGDGPQGREYLGRMRWDDTVTVNGVLY